MVFLGDFTRNSFEFQGSILGWIKVNCCVLNIFYGFIIFNFLLEDKTKLCYYFPYNETRLAVNDDENIILAFFGSPCYSSLN